MPDRSWTRLGSKYVGDYKVVRLREDRYRFEPAQTEADFIVCESADWVLVIPFTTDGDVVFVRQYRHGIQSVVLEIPGGLLDSGESPVDAAARELREETGYQAERLRHLGHLLPNPALNEARCHVVVAEGCRLAGSPTPDPLERLEVHLHPLNKVAEMIGTGEFCHAQAIAAFARFGTIHFGAE